jgi:hypothetical protein
MRQIVCENSFCSSRHKGTFRDMNCVRMTLVLYRRRALKKKIGGGTGRRWGARSIKPSEGSRSRGGRGPMEIEWSARAMPRSGRAVRRGDDADRGSVRAGKRAKRSCWASGKQREERRSWWTRHTRTGRGQARKVSEMERAVSCGSRELGRWGAELDLSS